MARRLRNEDGIREHVVHGLKARARGVTKSGDLDRGRLAGEDMEPVAGRMPGHVDQDIDPVGLDTIGQLVIRHLPGVDPDIRHRPELVRYLIPYRRARIADDLKTGMIMMAQYR